MITSMMIAALLGANPTQPTVQVPLTIEWHLTSTHPTVSSGSGFALAGWAMPIPPATELRGGGYSLRGGLTGAPAAPSPCSADLNGDGTIDTLDLYEAFDRFAILDAAVFDLDGDGVSTVLDLLAYLDQFTTGCD